MVATDDRSPTVRAVAASFMAVASVTVILRCYVRLRVIRSFGWDDGAMVFAMTFYLMFSGCMIGGSLYGTGRRFDNLTAHERVVAMKYWWLCEVAYCLSSIGCKVSVCIFLMRVTVKRVHHYILYVVMVLTAISGLVFMLLMLLQCRPLSYFWTQTAFDPRIKGSCINMRVIIIMTYIYSAFAAICDFTVGILPIFLVRKLNMPRQTKYAVASILGMACIASCAVIIRLPFVQTFKNPDFLYATVDIAIWSNIEAGLGISAGSLATLRPLLRRFLATAPEPYSDRPSRKPPLSRDRHIHLNSLDGPALGLLRPDRVAITVTTIQTKENSNTYGWFAPDNSEERLHETQEEMGLSIHRSFKVVRTSANAWP